MVGDDVGEFWMYKCYVLLEIIFFFLCKEKFESVRCRSPRHIFGIIDNLREFLQIIHDLHRSPYKSSIAEFGFVRDLFCSVIHINCHHAALLWPQPKERNPTTPPNFFLTAPLSIIPDQGKYHNCCCSQINRNNLWDVQFWVRS